MNLEQVISYHLDKVFSFWSKRMFIDTNNQRQTTNNLETSLNETKIQSTFQIVLNKLNFIGGS